MHVRKKKISVSGFLIVLCLCLWGLVLLFPFYNSVLISLVPQHVFQRTPLLLYPKELTFDSYSYVFHSDLLLTGLRNTIFIVVVGTLYNVLLTVGAAYPLTKPIPGRRFFTFFIVFTMFFSGGMITFYLQIKNLHLVNTIWSMILPTGMSVTYLLIMESYFRTIPAEIEESARLDGANEIDVLFRIVLPLSLPMLATITLFYGVERWNEWYNGMLFISDVNKYPLQLLIMDMLQSTTSLQAAIPQAQQHQAAFSLGMQMAAVIASMLPIVCLYPFLQKYFVKGLTLGGVKL